MHRRCYFPAQTGRSRCQTIPLWVLKRMSQVADRPSSSSESLKGGHDKWKGAEASAEHNSWTCSSPQVLMVSASKRSGPNAPPHTHPSFRAKQVMFEAMLFHLTMFAPLTCCRRARARGQLPGAEMLPAPSSARGKPWRGRRWLVQLLLISHWLPAVSVRTQQVPGPI